MRLNQFLFMYLFLFITLIAFLFISCESQKASTEMTEEQMLERGEFLVTIGGCDDCHTPKNMGAKGPELDINKRFSGYQEGTKLPPIDTSVLGPWIYMAGDLTAAVGPWGITYAINLTPDEKTGIGTWKAEMFINAMKSGKHLGVADSRPILPPMPWQNLSKLPEEDLRAMFMFLMSQTPVKNSVPEPMSLEQFLATQEEIVAK